MITLNGEKKRTRAIKKGGQHPEWDDELRFTLFEDTEDMLERMASAGDEGTPPPPPPASATHPAPAPAHTSAPEAPHVADHSSNSVSERPSLWS